MQSLSFWRFQKEEWERLQERAPFETEGALLALLTRSMQLMA
jgi:hypothetical protein